MVAPTGQPPEGLEAIAGVLRGPRSALVAGDGPADRLAQPGGACLPGSFPVPMPGPDDPVFPVDGEPVIEMFIVGRDGMVEATGPDPSLARWWRADVEALIDRVRSAAAAVGVELVEPISITASATPADRVVGDPHLDDDRFEPDEGVGLVAVAASHLGPRLEVGELACRALRAGLPVELEPGEVERFAGAGSLQQAPPDRIVVFARFGQLHAGPVPTSEASAREARNLLVLRAGTRPAADAQERLGSGPT
jgi:hypothetical protein